MNCPYFCTALTTVVAVVMNSLVFREIATFSCGQKYPGNGRIISYAILKIIYQCTGSNTTKIRIIYFLFSSFSNFTVALLVQLQFRFNFCKTFVRQLGGGGLAYHNTSLYLQDIYVCIYIYIYIYIFNKRSSYEVLGF